MPAGLACGGACTAGALIGAGFTGMPFAGAFEAARDCAPADAWVFGKAAGAPLAQGVPADAAAAAPVLAGAAHVSASLGGPAGGGCWLVALPKGLLLRSACVPTSVRPMLGTPAGRLLPNGDVPVGWAPAPPAAWGAETVCARCLPRPAPFASTKLRSAMRGRCACGANPVGPSSASSILPGATHPGGPSASMSVETLSTGSAACHGLSVCPEWG